MTDAKPNQGETFPAAVAPAPAGETSAALTADLLSALEALVYVAEAPATCGQMAAALGVEPALVEQGVAELMSRYASDGRGIEIRCVAGGYRMATKPQHHEVLRRFIKSLQPPIRLSLAALETLAVIAYRQPVTAPEIKDIRGVDPSGVLNTLLDRKLIATAGRKDVVGKPILYKTTQEFLLRFGLAKLSELPTLKEFEEMAKAGLEGIEVAADEVAPLTGPFGDAGLAADSTAPASSHSGSAPAAELRADGDAGDDSE